VRAPSGGPLPGRLRGIAPGPLRGTRPTSRNPADLAEPGLPRRNPPTSGDPGYLAGRGLLGGQAELLDPVADLVAVDAEELGRLRLVAAGAVERLGQQLTLDVIEVDAFLGQPELRW